MIFTQSWFEFKQIVRKEKVMNQRYCLQGLYMTAGCSLETQDYIEKHPKFCSHFNQLTMHLTLRLTHLRTCLLYIGERLDFLVSLWAQIKKNSLELFLRGCWLNSSSDIPDKEITAHSVLTMSPVTEMLHVGLNCDLNILLQETKATKHEKIKK